MATTYTKEAKPGNGGDITLTWDEATESWNDISGTWDAPLAIAATAYTKETKHATAFTKEPKP